MLVDEEANEANADIQVDPELVRLVDLKTGGVPPDRAP